MLTLRYLFAIFVTVSCLLAVGVLATDGAGTKFLLEKAKEADVITLPSGLQYKVLEKGNVRLQISKKSVYHYELTSCMSHKYIYDNTGSFPPNGEQSVFMPLRWYSY